MTATGTLHVLPIWVWLLFAILLVGVIVFFYTQGNWRTTLTAFAVTIGLALAITGVTVWIEYLQSHFIGQFDHLGIPFRTAGPGWDILWGAWPLWLVPMMLTAILLFFIDWILRYFFVTKTTKVSPDLTEQLPPEIPLAPWQGISQKIEYETLKRELANVQERLAETIDLAETQLDKKQYLEAKLEQTKDDYNQQIADLEERIKALTSDIQSYETNKEELTSLTLKQNEEIYELKNQLERKS